ncbi:hypothetical protein JKP88DRAFT_308906 [Tribonema minus]|uniref:Uncharacterized protein n=1 Tax=Tribonema minus TaxID=303371 RepID=A0A835Z896_9STRA|nr:hypothetical protein JKP88DRAFT_308906 [Tribonema minus]
MCIAFVAALCTSLLLSMVMTRRKQARQVTILVAEMLAAEERGKQALDAELARRRALRQEALREAGRGEEDEISMELALVAPEAATSRTAQGPRLRLQGGFGFDGPWVSRQRRLPNHFCICGYGASQMLLVRQLRADLKVADEEYAEVSADLTAVMRQLHREQDRHVHTVGVYEETRDQLSLTRDRLGASTAEVNGLKALLATSAAGSSAAVRSARRQLSAERGAHARTAAVYADTAIVYGRTRWLLRVTVRALRARTAEVGVVHVELRAERDAHAHTTAAHARAHCLLAFASGALCAGAARVDALEQQCSGLEVRYARAAVLLALAHRALRVRDGAETEALEQQRSALEVERCEAAAVLRSERRAHARAREQCSALRADRDEAAALLRSERREHVRAKGEWEARDCARVAWQVALEGELALVLRDVTFERLRRQKVTLDLREAHRELASLRAAAPSADYTITVVQLRALIMQLQMSMADANTTIVQLQTDNAALSARAQSSAATAAIQGAYIAKLEQQRSDLQQQCSHAQDLVAAAAAAANDGTTQPYIALLQSVLAMSRATEIAAAVKDEERAALEAECNALRNLNLKLQEDCAEMRAKAARAAVQGHLLQRVHTAPAAARREARDRPPEAAAAAAAAAAAVPLGPPRRDEDAAELRHRQARDSGVTAEQLSSADHTSGEETISEVIEIAAPFTAKTEETAAAAAAAPVVSQALHDPDPLAAAMDILAAAVRGDGSYRCDAPPGPAALLEACSAVAAQLDNTREALAKERESLRALRSAAQRAQQMADAQRAAGGAGVVKGLSVQLFKHGLNATLVSRGSSRPRSAEHCYEAAVDADADAVAPHSVRGVAHALPLPPPLRTSSADAPARAASPGSADGGCQACGGGGGGSGGGDCCCGSPVHGRGRRQQRRYRAHARDEEGRGSSSRSRSTSAHPPGSPGSCCEGDALFAICNRDSVRGG